MLGAIVLRGIAVGCIVAGLLNDITWLFWLGIVIATPYVILGVIIAFVRTIVRAGVRRIWIYPLVLCWALLFAFIIAPPVLLVYWVILMLHGLLILAFGQLALGETTMKGLVILGSILVIAGLILETIVTW